MDTNELKGLAEAAGLVDWKWWTSNSVLRLTTEREGRHGADGDAISAYRDNVQCPEAYRAFIEKASPAAVGELATRNKELADEIVAVEFQKKILGEALKKDRAEIERLKHEIRLLTEHNEFLSGSGSRLAPELRAVKDALGLDFTASVSGEVVPLIERLRKLPTCWTEVLEQSEANDQLLDQVLELSAELDGYKQGAQVEADAGDEARAEVKALRSLAIELRGAAKCYNLHHCKAEQHAISEPCKVLARIDAAMSKEGK